MNKLPYPGNIVKRQCLEPMRLTGTRVRQAHSRFD